MTSTCCMIAVIFIHLWVTSTCSSRADLRHVLANKLSDRNNVPNQTQVATLHTPPTRTSLALVLTPYLSHTHGPYAGLNVAKRLLTKLVLSPSLTRAHTWPKFKKFTQQDVWKQNNRSLTRHVCTTQILKMKQLYTQRLHTYTNTFLLVK